MTRDDIIRIARETTLINTNASIQCIERFAALVTAAEREECAVLAAWILKMPENDVSAAIRARGEQ